MNELSIIFRNINMEIPYKVQDSFSNGVHIYAFYSKIKINEDQLAQILFDANNLLNSSNYLLDFYINKKITCKEFIYL